MGVGGFSDVWRCVWKRLDASGCEYSEQVAVKVLRTHSIVVNDKQRAKFERRLSREIQVWDSLQHPNVLKLYGTCASFGPYLAMVSPWHPNGNVINYLRNLGQGATTLVRLGLLCEVATGLEYVHSHSIVHGDLNVNNILVKDGGVACLCDFGLANILETVGPTFATSAFAGSVRWMAPELVISSVDSQSKYIPHSFSTDVYSFGCVVYQLLSGMQPYFFFEG